MKLILLKPNSPEWEFAWNWLQNHPLNEGLSDPSTALNEEEAWQYTGSFYNDTNKLISSFRHRLHPRTGLTHNLSVEHLEFNEQSFDKIINV